MILCTTEISKVKYNKHKELAFRSLKNYLPDVYKETLWRVLFPKYDDFIEYGDFITRRNCVVTTVAPCITVRVKNNINEYFDGEITEKTCTSDKLYKTFKSIRSHGDKEFYKEMRNIVQNIIPKKKQTYFEEKPEENT